MSVPLPPCSLPAFLVALRDGLRARNGLAGVTVTIAPVPPDAIVSPMIRFAGTTDASQAIRTFGQVTVEENYTVEGRLWWIAGGEYGDAAIEAALTGAFGLYAEIEGYLRGSNTAPRVGGTVMRAEASLTRYVPEIFDTGTGVVLEFQIRVQNELHP